MLREGSVYVACGDRYVYSVGNGFCCLVVASLSEAGETPECIQEAHVS